MRLAAKAMLVALPLGNVYSWNLTQVPGAGGNDLVIMLESILKPCRLNNADYEYHQHFFQ